MTQPESIVLRPATVAAIAAIAHRRAAMSRKARQSSLPPGKVASILSC